MSALTMYRLTREPQYAQVFEGTLRWVSTRQTDWTNGEWFAEVRPDGSTAGVKGDRWKEGYHNGRALIEASGSSASSDAAQLRRYAPCSLTSLEVHVFHRCVIAVIGVLAISTSAAAGPIKFDAKAPSFDVAELRSMDSKELRALFFRGGGARNAAASCADCLSAESSLTARDRDGKSAAYKTVFPFTAARLFTKPAANQSSRRTAARPDLLAGPVAAATDAVGAVALSSSEGAAPLALVSPAAVPEPNTLALIGTGLAGAWLLRRRRQNSQQA